MNLYELERNIESTENCIAYLDIFSCNFNFFQKWKSIVFQKKIFRVSIKLLDFVRSRKILIFGEILTSLSWCNNTSPLSLRSSWTRVKMRHRTVRVKTVTLGKTYDIRVIISDSFKNQLKDSWGTEFCYIVACKENSRLNSARFDTQQSSPLEAEATEARALLSSFA